MGMPLREYYPVTRAAELLGCNVEDLFHWAEIGAIELRVSLKKETPAHLLLFKCINKESINELNVDGGYDGDFFKVSLCYKNDDEELISHFNAGAVKISDILSLHPIVISGLWPIPSYAIKHGSMDDYLNNDSVKLVSPEGDFQVQTSDFEILFSIENIYIMKKYFILIDNCKDKEDLPSYYNGGVRKPEVMLDSVTERKNTNEKVSATAKKAIRVLVMKTHPELVNNHYQLANVLSAEARELGFDNIEFNGDTVRNWMKSK